MLEVSVKQFIEKQFVEEQMFEKLSKLITSWLSLAQLGSAWLSLAQLGSAWLLSGILSPNLASFSPKPFGHVFSFRCRGAGETLARFFQWMHHHDSLFMSPSSDSWEVWVDDESFLFMNWGVEKVMTWMVYRPLGVAQHYIHYILPTHCSILANLVSL